MKRFLVSIIIVLLIPIIFLSIITFSKYKGDNKQEIDRSLENKLLEERNNKKRELDAIKESNKEKIDKYLKVKSWNEEITYYFD